MWNNALQSYGEFSFVRLDTVKAFDWVWHAAILNKLQSYELPSKKCQWTSNFLSGRRIQFVAGWTSA